MASPKHLDRLKSGSKKWNEWRNRGAPHSFQPDLTGADLGGANLTKADFKVANLSEANLRETNLAGADLTGATLTFANLSGANLTGANLSGANLSNAQLTWANFQRSLLDSTDFRKAILGGTAFPDVHLGNALNLQFCEHLFPSSIGIDTLFRSAGRIPEGFLRGAGVPDALIAYIPSIFANAQAIQFYSCFISYSHADEEFARRLFSGLQDNHLRVWFAPEEMKAGHKLFDQIDEAIRLHDKLLLVLSDASLVSEWVMTEIRRARAREVKEKKRVLFPIRLTDMATLKEWTCFDADTGKDLAVELREYFIPDFSNWKDHDSFQRAFDRLLRDLKASEKVSGSGK